MRSKASKGKELVFVCEGKNNSEGKNLRIQAALTGKIEDKGHTREGSIGNNLGIPSLHKHGNPLPYKNVVAFIFVIRDKG